LKNKQTAPSSYGFVGVDEQGVVVVGEDGRGKREFFRRGTFSVAAVVVTSTGTISDPFI